MSWIFDQGSHVANLGLPACRPDDDELDQYPEPHQPMLTANLGTSRPLDDLPSAPSWMRRAQCKSTPDVHFFAYAARRAIAVCESCGVRATCLRYAIDNAIEYGVWGGTTALERRSLPGFAKGSQRHGTLYVASMGEIVKIGFTTRPLNHRLWNLRGQHPDRSAAPLSVLYAVDGTAADETALHSTLDAFRAVVGTQREWYHDSPQFREALAAALPTELAVAS